VGDTSLVFNVVGKDKGANALIARTAGNVRASNMLAKASTLAFGAAAVSAGANLLALAAAATQVAGAAALVPGALGAAVAMVATAKVAGFGLADAWKATGEQATSGGGSAVNTARQVAAAQREVKAATQALADAQRAALDAQAAVTRARQDEAERLDDLSRSMASARLDEEGSILAVQRAEQRLAEVRANPKSTALDIREAELAYRQAQQSVLDLTDRVDDLSQEQQDGARKGVEGSDAVQGALRQQQDAQRQVADAAQRLADAQEAVGEASVAAGGGIDRAAQALAALSPNARNLILTLRALAPVWVGVRNSVQDAVFRGVAGDIRALSMVYLPIMRTGLTQIGRGFNVAIRESLGLARTAAFSRDVSLVLGNTATTVDRLARLVRPLVNGFMQFAVVGSTFLPGIANSTLSIAQRFERWAIASRESGKIKDWIGTALGLLRQFGQIALNVGGAVGAIFKAGGGTEGKSMIDGLVRGTAAMTAWMNSAQGQEKISNALKALRDIINGVAAAMPTLADNAGTFKDTLDAAGPVVKTLADNSDLLGKALPFLAAGFLAAKAAEMGANVASIIRLPILAAQVAANWGLRAALTAHTAALAANTAVTTGATGAEAANTAVGNVGIATKLRGVAATVASRIATMAAAVATGAWTAAQWLLNAAMTANPIGLIIVGVLLLVAGIILLWQNSETFRRIVTGAFNAVWGAIKVAWDWVKNNWPLLLGILTGPIGLAVWAITHYWDKIKAGAAAAWKWITGKFDALIGFVSGLPKRIGKAASGLWDGIKNSFRAAINWMIGRWNDFHLTLGGGSIMGIGIPSVTLDTPNIPYLAAGGTAVTAGMARVGDRGPEDVFLPRGASVIPLSDGSGPREIRVVFDLTGADADMRRMFKKWVRLDGGGSVQVAFGRSGR
jgi:hypothetical protein